MLVLIITIFTRKVITARLTAKSAHSLVPGYSHHPAQDLKITYALPESVSILSLEMFHSHQRARLILSCETTQDEALTQETLWTSSLCANLLDQTQAHVVLLEVINPKGELIWQHLQTSDHRGWTGDALDQIDYIAHRIN